MTDAICYESHMVSAYGHETPWGKPRMAQVIYAHCRELAAGVQQQIQECGGIPSVLLQEKKERVKDKNV